MTKCRYAKKYKGIRFPKCGCDECLRIWYEAECNRLIAYCEVLIGKLNNG